MKRLNKLSTKDDISFPESLLDVLSSEGGPNSQHLEVNSRQQNSSGLLSSTHWAHHTMEEDAREAIWVSWIISLFNILNIFGYILWVYKWQEKSHRKSLKLTHSSSKMGKMQVTKSTKIT